MLKNEELKTYNNIVKNIVKKCGGYREKDIMKNPYIIKKSETWNKEHKVLNIIENDRGFSVDLVTMKICG